MKQPFRCCLNPPRKIRESIIFSRKIYRRLRFDAVFAFSAYDVIKQTIFFPCFMSHHVEQTCLFILQMFGRFGEIMSDFSQKIRESFANAPIKFCLPNLTPPPLPNDPLQFVSSPRMSSKVCRAMLPVTLG